MNHKVPAIYLLLLFQIYFLNYVHGQVCYQPNKQLGTCISVHDCPSAVKLFKPNGGVSVADARFLNSIHCVADSGVFPAVCCVDNIDPITKSPPIIIEPITKSPPIINEPTIPSSIPNGDILPVKGQCGLEPFGNRIYNGKSTGIDEFPWMALLQYESQTTGKKQFSCGGVLINHWYVLTAAHCLTGEINRKIGDLKTVRLGEYDLTSETDCVLEDCSDPVQDIDVTDIIPHSEYDETNRNRYNDIGLVRLANAIVKSIFVQPICLPSTLLVSRSLPPMSLISAGWGRTLIARQSNVKLKISLPLADHEKCKEKYMSINAAIKDTQLCAGGVFAEDTCDGDSGGPLMKLHNSYWLVEGIVSFGRGCGLEGWPAIYTRVESYDSWIREHLRP